MERSTQNRDHRAEYAYNGNKDKISIYNEKSVPDWEYSRRKISEQTVSRTVKTGERQI